MNLRQNIKASYYFFLRLFWPRKIDSQLYQLKKKVKYTSGVFYHEGMKIFFPDSHSFYFMYREIFQHQIYCFNSEAERIYILDCGSNIGLSVIYFAENFRNAEIHAFEPDETIFSYLEKNVKNLNNKNVFLHKQAVWYNDELLSFSQEGSDSGRLVDVNLQSLEKRNVIVEAVDLNNYLTKQVDFLKIDIEGAELDVLKGIKNNLHFVRNIFIEYHSFELNQQVLDQILRILKNAGFRYYIENPTNHRVRPYISFPRYLEMDLLVNIYGVK